MYITAPEVALSAVEAKARKGSVGSDSIEATFVDPFDQRNGRITAYTVVVTTDTSDPELKSLSALLNTWKEKKDGNKKSWLVSHMFQEIKQIDQVIL